VVRFWERFTSPYKKAENTAEQYVKWIWRLWSPEDIVAKWRDSQCRASGKAVIVLKFKNPSYTRVEGGEELFEGV
jgi:hypothetical protein